MNYNNLEENELEINLKTINLYKPIYNTANKKSAPYYTLYTTDNSNKLFINALSFLYKYNSNKSYQENNNFSLEAIMPDIEIVPDGSIGGGTNGYTSWTVLGCFIPSENKIKLTRSSGEHVLNHELGHWYAHWLNMPHPTTEVAETLAERHKYDGRSLFELIKNSKNKYIKKAA